MGIFKHGGYVFIHNHRTKIRRKIEVRNSPISTNKKDKHHENHYRV